MSGISTLGQALNQINRLQSQQNIFQELSTQLTTGKKTQSFAGLDKDVIYSKRSRANINSIDTYTANITNVNRRIEQMDLALNQVQEQARILVNSLTVSPSQGDYPDFETIQALANNVYDFLVDLVNEKDGDRYLFAGADSDTKPLGNTEGLREILLAVGVLKDLPPPEYAPGALNDPTATTFAGDTPPFPPAEKQENFFQVLSSISATLSQAVDKVDDSRYQLAQTQVQMDKLNEFYTFEKKTFQDTVSEVEDADMTEVAAKINSLQIQLEASYTVTASISQLSLVNYFRG